MTPAGPGQRAFLTAEPVEPGLAPGFSCAEEFAGTNGIGMPLESGQAAHVFGHERYAEQLGDLADAGVRVRDPIPGRGIRAVDFTCWRTDAGRLSITLAQSTAGQVTQGCSNDSSARAGVCTAG